MDGTAYNARCVNRVDDKGRYIEWCTQRNYGPISKELLCQSQLEVREVYLITTWKTHQQSTYFTDINKSNRYRSLAVFAFDIRTLRGKRTKRMLTLVVFEKPGAYTCQISKTHFPSFIRVKYLNYNYNYKYKFTSSPRLSSISAGLLYVVQAKPSVVHVTWGFYGIRVKGHPKRSDAACEVN